MATQRRHYSPPGSVHLVSVSRIQYTFFFLSKQVNPYTSTCLTLTKQTRTRGRLERRGISEKLHQLHGTAMLCAIRITQIRHPEFTMA